MAQASQVAEDGHSDANGVVKVPPELRKAKVAQVMGLLEREFVHCSTNDFERALLTITRASRSALVDATLSRLERLNLGSAFS